MRNLGSVSVEPSELVMDVDVVVGICKIWCLQVIVVDVVLVGWWCVLVVVMMNVYCSVCWECICVCCGGSGSVKLLGSGGFWLVVVDFVHDRCDDVVVVWSIVVVWILFQLGVSS